MRFIFTGILLLTMLIKLDAASTMPNLMASNKFCYTDMETGMETQLTLHDGGEAEIAFLNSSGVVVRSGSATWRGTSDGPGGDMAKVYLRLSTGVTLTFRLVVDQYTSKITMLMDSRDNMWTACY